MKGRKDNGHAYSACHRERHQCEKIDRCAAEHHHQTPIGMFSILWNFSDSVSFGKKDSVLNLFKYKCFDEVQSSDHDGYSSDTKQR